MPSQPTPSNDNPGGKGFSNSVDAGKSRLPFEPTQNRKKQAKKPASAPAKAKPEKSGKKASQSTVSQRAFAGVPAEVSQRMARRMAFFSGIPTSLGMLTFIMSYFIVSRNLYKLPTVAVLLVSLGFFGLGVLGLSYGALSASWDEGREGSWFGWEEFGTNFGRAISSWKSARENAAGE